MDAILTFREGRCDLATNRNLPDPDRPDGLLTGYDPEHQRFADDVIMAGRVARVEDGATLATIVHDACHPTTLGGENGLVSPDYVGRMREVVEAHTGGRPNLFPQRASGSLAPAHRYVEDPRSPMSGRSSRARRSPSGSRAHTRFRVSTQSET